MSAKGEKGSGVQQLNTHAEHLAVHSEGTGGVRGDTTLPWGTGVKEQLSVPASKGCSFPAQGQLLAMLLQDATEMTVEPACRGQAQRVPSPLSHTKPLTQAASLSTPGHQTASYTAHTPCWAPQPASRPCLKIGPKDPEEGKCNRILTCQSSPSHSAHFDCCWSAY